MNDIEYTELVRLEKERRAVEYGHLQNSVNTLVLSVAKLETTVSDLKQQISTGKGLATGLFISAGAIGGVLGSIAHKAIELVR